MRPSLLSGCRAALRNVRRPRRLQRILPLQSQLTRHLAHMADPLLIGWPARRTATFVPRWTPNRLTRRRRPFPLHPLARFLTGHIVRFISICGDLFFFSFSFTNLKVTSPPKHHGGDSACQTPLPSTHPSPTSPQTNTRTETRRRPKPLDLVCQRLLETKPPSLLSSCPRRRLRLRAVQKNKKMKAHDVKATPWVNHALCCAKQEETLKWWWMCHLCRR